MLSFLSLTQNALHKIRVFLQWMEQLLLSYFALYYWGALAFVVCFFFPTLTAYALAALGLGLGKTLRFCAALHEAVAQLGVHFVLWWAAFACSLLALVWSWSSWLSLLGNALACLFLMPVTLNELLVVGIQFVAALVLSQGLGRTCYTLGSLALVLAVAVFLAAKRRCCRGKGGAEGDADGDSGSSDSSSGSGGGGG